MLSGKEGPVHDVRWSFSGKEFAVVYGCIRLCLSGALIIIMAINKDFKIYFIIKGITRLLYNLISKNCWESELVHFTSQ